MLKNGPARVGPGGRLKRGAQPLRSFRLVHLLADIEDDPQRRDHDFACGERGDDAAADPPVPAQRLDRRLDQPAHAAQQALPLLRSSMRLATSARPVLAACSLAASPAARASSRSCPSRSRAAVRGASSLGEIRG